MYQPIQLETKIPSLRNSISGLWLQSSRCSWRNGQRSERSRGCVSVLRCFLKTSARFNGSFSNFPKILETLAGKSRRRVMKAKPHQNN
jgi:hypothetical protein